MISMVVRAFRGPHGMELKSGDGPIDTTAWRTERQLHSTRYLRPATREEEARAPAPAGTADQGAAGKPKRVLLKEHGVHEHVA